ncbi:MAG: hypothetical protein V1898_03205 [Patescibacteria group bacterium]
MKIENKKKCTRQCMCTYQSHGHKGRCKNKFKTNILKSSKAKVYCEDCYEKIVN